MPDYNMLNFTTIEDNVAWVVPSKVTCVLSVTELKGDHLVEISTCTIFFGPAESALHVKGTGSEVQLRIAQEL